MLYARMQRLMTMMTQGMFGGILKSPAFYGWLMIIPQQPIRKVNFCRRNMSSNYKLMASSLTYSEHSNERDDHVEACNRGVQEAQPLFSKGAPVYCLEATVLGHSLKANGAQSERVLLKRSFLALRGAGHPEREPPRTQLLRWTHLFWTRRKR